jgi:hypothetical protein
VLQQVLPLMQVLLCAMPLSGFDRTSRFAALYQQAYGVPASHTLHQDEPT